MSKFFLRLRYFFGLAFSACIEILVRLISSDLGDCKIVQHPPIILICIDAIMRILTLSSGLLVDINFLIVAEITLRIR